jgi:hypothetical protein
MSATSNPPVSAENAQYTLWCLVEGDSSPFPVTVPAGTNVAVLKKSIHTEGINTSDPVLPKDLILWKVSTF